MDFSQVTESLFIGTTPGMEDYQRLRDLRVQLVINLRVERRPYPDPHAPPMPVLWLRTFDTPLIPISMRALEAGVKAALETTERGGKVYAHCAGGVHRSAALGATILIAQGYTAEAAMALIKERRPAADPYAWYIRRRIMRFAEIWDHRYKNIIVPVD